MPEIQHPVRPGPGKTRPQHHVRLARQDGPGQSLVIRRIILQVRILHDDDGSGSLGKAGAQSRPFAPVDRVPQELDAPVRLGQRLEHFPGSIPRGIVHHDHLLHQRLGQNGLQDGGNGARLVVGRNDHRQAGGFGRGRRIHWRRDSLSELLGCPAFSRKFAPKVNAKPPGCELRLTPAHFPRKLAPFKCAIAWTWSGNIRIIHDSHDQRA